MNEEQDSFPYRDIPKEDRDMNHFRPFSAKGRMSGEPHDPSNTAFQEIVSAIRSNGGKIPFSQFMGISLIGEDGYYSKGKAKIGVIKSPGERVDFFTSPEKSPVFGRTIARQMISVWQAMGKPETFQLVEVGGGTGALAKSFVESVKQLDPDFYQALSYTILEYGDLIDVQKATIGNIEEQNKVTWIQGSALDFPFRNIEGAIISNELLDALPIERVARIDGQIKQKFVSVDKQGRFFEEWGEASSEVLAYIQDYGLNIREKIEESINLNAAKFQKNAQSALSKGVILTIDYGLRGEVGEESMQLMRYHGYVDNPETGHSEYVDTLEFIDDTPPYNYPGQVDITADVNFKPLEQITSEAGLDIVFSGSQRDFLKQAGLDAELALISQSIEQAESADLKAKLGRDYNSAEQLITDRLGGFYTLFLSKGVQIQGALKKSRT